MRLKLELVLAPWQSSRCFAGLIAIKRAQATSGVDYYLAEAGQSNKQLRVSMRLEISGTHLGWQEVESRLQRKLLQAERGQSDGNAMAVIVGFHIRKILIGRLGEKS